MIDYSDIRLNDDFDIVASASGDFPIILDKEALLQLLKVEACTAKGELFYDENFGWSLIDFIHYEDNELNTIEIKNRIYENFAKYSEVNINSINTQLMFIDEKIKIEIIFKFVDEDIINTITADLNRIEVIIT